MVSLYHELQNHRKLPFSQWEFCFFNYGGSQQYTGTFAVCLLPVIYCISEELNYLMWKQAQMIPSESQVLVKKQRSNSRCLVLQSMFSVQKLQIVLNLKININALKFGDVSPYLLKYQEKLHAKCNILGGIFAGLWKQNVAWFARSISFWCTAQTNSLGCIFINPKFEHTFNRCSFYLI